MLVFVYGTLKKGFRLSDVLKTSEYMGEGTINARMYDYGAFPACIADPDRKVHGEVYNVTPEVKQELDMIEGVPRLYHLERVNVKMKGDDKKEVEALVYFMWPYQIKGYDEVLSGIWENESRKWHYYKEVIQ